MLRKAEENVMIELIQDNSVNYQSESAPQSVIFVGVYPQNTLKQVSFFFTNLYCLLSIPLTGCDSQTGPENMLLTLWALKNDK